jgi:hypothetical protein
LAENTKTVDDGHLPIEELFAAYQELLDYGWRLDVITNSQPAGTQMALPIIASRSPAGEHYDKVEEQDGYIAHCPTVVTISADMTRPGIRTEICDKIGIHQAYVYKISLKFAEILNPD